MAPIDNTAFPVHELIYIFRSAEDVREKNTLTHVKDERILGEN